MKRSGRIFGLAATYIGTVVGAGFASGQEIWTFFARYGPLGYLGLALAGLLFARAGRRALLLGRQYGRDQTYYRLLQALLGPFAPVFDLILIAFLCVLSGVMLAGAGALTLMLCGLAWPGVAAMAAAGLIVVAAGVPGMVLVNKLVVPCLILLTAAVSLGGLLLPAHAAPAAFPAAGWLPSSLLYASYNTVLSLPVLAALGAAESDPSILKAGAAWGAAGLSLTAALIAGALLANASLARAAEVPMAAIAGGFGGFFGLAYAFVLWAEMFTTLVADVYGAAARLAQLGKGSRTLWAAAVMGLGLLLSNLGFARLVRTAYPAFGLLCLLILVRLVAFGGLYKKKEFFATASASQIGPKKSG